MSFSKSAGDPTSGTGIASLRQDQDAEAGLEHDEKLRNVATLIPVGAVELTPEYREYLIQRHGTVDLDPLPGFGDADPFNWPKWKVSLSIWNLHFFQNHCISPPQAPKAKCTNKHYS